MGNTTLPAASTQPRAGRGSLALHSVFPRSARAPLALERSPLVLGRDEDCDLILPGSEASRRHAELRREGPLWIIRDLRSRNGVFVNGARTDQAPLEQGTVLRLGDWVGVVAPAPLADQLATPRPIGGRLFGGAALARSLELGLRAAASELPLIIQGETGTGKELTARLLHERSGRQGPFVGVNCAALPEALAEGELFGYRRGAFTGADRASLGFFRAAQGGTLLLDELTDLPLALQGKLLRALEERQIVPLGESSPVPIDVRLIAATQQPLAEAVQDKRFRADLLARLNGLTIELPPLRERREDIGYLFEALLAHHSGTEPEVDPRLVERLCVYDWPFNVRELDLLVRRLLVLHRHEPVLKRAFLPRPLLQPTEDASTDRHEQDLQRLAASLRRHKGNVARAAAEAGISRQRAYRLMDSDEELKLEEFRSDQGAP